MKNENSFKRLLANIIINGILECKSGLHIGGSSDTIEIGGIDSPVIRNPITNEPYIPGSSLKGKLRSIVEKIATDANGSPILLEANRKGDEKNMIYRHECDDFANNKGEGDLSCPLCRIFGSTGRNEGVNWPALLIVRDGGLTNKDFLMHEGFPVYEAKMENSIDRLTSAAHPRCVERVPAGTKFFFELIFRVEAVGNGSVIDNKTPPFCYLDTDIKNILQAMQILELDGLGGFSSRGSGQLEGTLKNTVF